MMKEIACVVLILLISSGSFSQETNDSIDFLLHIEDDVERMDSLHNLSFSFYNISPHKGIVYGAESLRIAEELNNLKGMARGFNVIGAHYWAMGDYKMALDYFLQALKPIDLYHQTISQVEKDKSKLIESSIIGNIGVIYHEQGNYAKALEYHFKGLDIYIERKNKRLISLTLSNIASANEKMKNYEKALDYHNQSLKLKKELKDTLGISSSYYYIGLVHSGLSQIDSALYYYDKSLKLKQQISDKHGLARLYNQIGKSNLALNNMNQALLHAQQGVEIAKAIDAKQFMKEGYLLLSDTYAKLDNYEKAYEYHRLQGIVKDSILSEETSKQLATMQVRFESAQKEKENELLRINNEIQRLDIEKQTSLRNSFIILSIFVILLVLLVYSRFILKRNANLLLAKNNKIITQKKEELAAALLQLQEVNHILEEQKEEIQTQAESLMEANATKDRFFSIIAHDLRNPFNSILGYSDLLITNYNDFSQKEIKEFIVEIDKSSKNTYALLENLLHWARSQKEGIVINREKLNLAELFDESIKPYTNIAKMKYISILNEIPNDIFVETDKYTMTTTFRNLINNAIKFTPEKGRIVIYSKLDKGQIEIGIQDTGVGMNQNTINNLFRIDKSFSTPGTNMEKGTGLGLILCKEFIEKNDGHIYVESELGKGSTFKIVLPV